MSLINDMLRDLDKRRARSLDQPDGALHNLDLGAGGGGRRPRVLLYLAAALLGVGALAGAGYFVWVNLDSVLQSRAPQAAASAPAGERPAGSATALAPAASPAPPPAKPARRPAPVTPPSPAANPTATASAKAASAPAPARSPAPKQSAAPTHAATTKQASTTKQPSGGEAKPRRASQEDGGAMQKRRRPLTPTQRSELAYQQGYRLLSKGDTERGEAKLRAALQADAHNLQARELLAGVYIRAGRLVEASGLLKRGVSIAPKHTVFAQLYARVLVEQGRAPAAVSVLEQHRSAAHGDMDYLAMLAALYQRVGRQREAAQAYRQLVQARPGAGDWWAGLGISLEALDRPGAARQAYQRAQSTGSLNPQLAKYTRQRLAALK